VNINHLLDAKTITAFDLHKICHDHTVTILDIRGSMQYRKEHLPNSLWATRSCFKDVIPKDCRKVLLVSDDPAVTYCALLELNGYDVQVFELSSSGFPLEFETISTPTIPADAQCIDYLFFVHDRHDGNKDAARRYLEWETGLIAQLDQDELNMYSIQ
jgi:hypothetical protein